jgi:2,4-dienoyl-CoA reductase-like NADH-dependent reductase (Old Yellow Enzyme family)
MPAHTTNFASQGLFSRRHLSYHRARAAGGVGMIITEGMRVHPSSLGRSTTVAAFDDAIVESLGELADVVHSEGAALAGQILHVGRQAGSFGLLSPGWGASPIPWSGTGTVPHEMTPAEIAEVVEAFGAAARRAQQAGVDALEVHLGHGHLLQQFLSPATNQRHDRYGGSLNSRLRLTLEVLDAVLPTITREPGGLPLILRISGDEFLPGGLDLMQMVDVVGLLLEEYPIDVLHVSHSAYVASWSVATQIADMTFEPMPFRSLPRAFSRAFPELAVMAVCRVDSLERAEEIVTSGDADLVALARPHIAAPDLVARYADGHQTPERTCIACNQGCTGRLELGLPISCVVNPEAGLEAEFASVRLAVEESASSSRLRRGEPQQVLVVGGGPAGLEAAVAAASTGLGVTRVEAESELGGALRHAAALELRAGIGDKVDQLVTAAHRHGVRVLCNTVADQRLLESPAAVDAPGTLWAHIILATGGLPTERPGDAGFPVVSVAEAIHAAHLLGDHVALVDEEGSWTAPALAHQLLCAGHQVTYISAQPAMSWRLPVYSKPAMMAKLRRPGFGAWLLRDPLGMGESGLDVQDTTSGATHSIPGVTTVVFLRATTPRLELLPTPPTEQRRPPDVVGDARSSRTALEAAFEGRVAGLASSGDDRVLAAALPLRAWL